jgi:hypothetical protein
LRSWLAFVTGGSSRRTLPILPESKVRPGMIKIEEQSSLD